MDVVSHEGKPVAASLGKQAEQLALDYLKSRKLKLVQRNFSCKLGEIDLIMKDKNSLVFVEVRYRTHQQFGSGAESIDYRKQQKIIKTAEFFLQRHVNYTQYPCRIDVISIGPGKSDIHWIPNAIER